MLPGLPALRSSQCVNQLPGSDPSQCVKERPGSDPSRRAVRGLTPGWVSAALLLVTLLLLPPPQIATDASTRQNPASSPSSDPARAERVARQDKVREIQRNATALLKRAAASPSDSGDRTKLLSDAARQIESLASDVSSPPALLPDDLRDELRQAAAALRKAPSSIEPFLALLGRVAARLDASLDLAFQGSYSQTKVAEPVYGGHGSAMGPPPDLPASGGTASSITSPIQFEEVPCIPVKTFCGGRTKDHIVESGGSGVALFDYDGDGLLDVYVVNAFELSDEREKIPHRNAPLKNLGGRKFKAVSAGSGVDVAPWANGV